MTPGVWFTRSMRAFGAQSEKSALRCVILERSEEDLRG
jgi:hypothetical protein